MLHAASNGPHSHCSVIYTQTIQISEKFHQLSIIHRSWCEFYQWQSNYHNASSILSDSKSSKASINYPLSRVRIAR